MESWPSPKLQPELQQLSLSGEPSSIDNTTSSVSTSGPTRELPIYCSTDPLSKSHLMQAANQNKDGVRKITEKYDSVDKLRSSVARDRLGDSSKSVSNKPGEISRLSKDTIGENSNLVRDRPGESTNLAKTTLGVSSDRGLVKMSDGASDISDPNPSSLSTTSNNSNATDSLTEQDLLQVEMFFRSHKTEVHVCQCLANLYFASGCEKRTGKQNWEFSVTGIPLLVLDTGEHHRKRRLQFYMAEKGTGFVLFKDVIDHLTKYSAPHSNFHTLHISTDHTKQAGLSFDDTAAASEFHRYLMSLINNPDDDLLNLSKKKKKKEASKPKVKKYKAPKKAEISQPCCFVHVTKLERPQLSELADELNDKHVDSRSLGSAETLDELSS